MSGVSSTALLALISTRLNTNGAAAHLVWGFVGLSLIVPLAKFASETLLIHLSQGVVFEIRVRLSRQILAAPLKRLEELGTHRLLATLTEDVPSIAEALSTVPVLIINLTIVISALVYLAWLSSTIFIVVVCFMALGIGVYQLLARRGACIMMLARGEWDAIFNHFQALTLGVKELKLHRQRREAFMSQVLQRTAATLRRQNLRGLIIFAAANSWGQALLFIFIGLLLFVLPGLNNLNAQQLTGYALTIIYLMAPLEGILGMFPALSRASVAFQKVRQLGLSLTEEFVNKEPLIYPRPNPCWRRLDLVGITYTYHNECEGRSFTLGPINLSLRPGEIVFLIGGNGCGKTTLSKILTGLYTPEAGDLRLDGLVIDEKTVDYYRHYFSAIFSDCYLFDSLLGINTPELDSQAHKYLVKLQLDHKVQIKDGIFSATDLSKGQRKRLSLLTAYLEDRPIYVLDEWAADQDPAFKEFLYLQLLPELKRRSKTVIAISHDNHYYYIADRIIKLDNGKVEYDRCLDR